MSSHHRLPALMTDILPAGEDLQRTLKAIGTDATDEVTAISRYFSKTPTTAVPSSTSLMYTDLMNDITEQLEKVNSRVASGKYSNKVSALAMYASLSSISTLCKILVEEELPGSETSWRLNNSRKRFYDLALDARDEYDSACDV
jgi:hypothetical protein